MKCYLFGKRFVCTTTSYRIRKVCDPGDRTTYIYPLSLLCLHFLSNIIEHHCVLTRPYLFSILPSINHLSIVVPYPHSHVLLSVWNMKLFVQCGSLKRWTLFRPLPLSFAASSGPWNMGFLWAWAFKSFSYSTTQLGPVS